MATTTRQLAMSIGIVAAEVIFTSQQAFNDMKLSGTGLDQLHLNRLMFIKGFSDAVMVAAVVCLLGILALALS
ncbi:MAG: hypothetical protein V7742_11585 [Halioglobus sp.]